MGEVVYLATRSRQRWPAVPATGSRKTLRIRHGQERHLPAGAVALCYTSAVGKPAIMLLSSAGVRLRERNLGAGQQIGLTAGVELHIVQSAMPEQLLLVVVDTRPAAFREGMQ
jgi:hypothetical protein